MATGTDHIDGTHREGRNDRLDATTDALAGWADYLAAMGWYVFPLVPGSKRPAIKAWQQRASTDRARIARCWAGGQPWNVGVACGPSRLVVIDLDTGTDGPDGAAGLAALAAERGGPLPSTYTVTTPSGGRHLYYTTPPGVRLRNTAGQLAPHVDTRAEGGYVVGPGSILPACGYELADDTDPAPLPAWLVQAVLERATTPVRQPDSAAAMTHPHAYGAAVLRRECQRVATAPSNQHNAVLSSAAYRVGRVIGGGLLDIATARAELLHAAAALITGDCGCTTRETARVIDAGLTAGARNPRRPATPTATEAA